MAFAWGPRDLDAPDQNVFILFFSAFFQDKNLIEIIWTKYPEKVDIKLNLDKRIWRQQDLKMFDGYKNSEVLFHMFIYWCSVCFWVRNAYAFKLQVITLPPETCPSLSSLWVDGDAIE